MRPSIALRLFAANQHSGKGRPGPCSASAEAKRCEAERVGCRAIFQGRRAAYRLFDLPLFRSTNVSMHSFRFTHCSTLPYPRTAISSSFTRPRPSLAWYFLSSKNAKDCTVGLRALDTTRRSLSSFRPPTSPKSSTPGTFEAPSLVRSSPTSTRTQAGML